LAANRKKSFKQDSNSWMATYTDLMILLLTFFVLLLSLSTVDKRRKRLAVNSLVGAFGFKPGAHSILGKEKGLNITAGSAPLVEEDIQFERLRNVALRNGVKSDIDMSRQLERTIITFKNRVLFAQGSDQINPESMKFLYDLADVIRGTPRLIELRGYTDSTEIAFQTDRLKYSMYLSSKRAMAVFDFLKEKSGISGKVIVAHGFGLNPEGGKNTGKRHPINRQVEIILDYREEIPHRYKKPERPDSVLDFNGFFFRYGGKIDG
jgi:chemotaxis protein MotB